MNSGGWNSPFKWISNWSGWRQQRQVTGGERLPQLMMTTCYWQIIVTIIVIVTKLFHCSTQIVTSFRPVPTININPNVHFQEQLGWDWGHISDQLISRCFLSTAARFLIATFNETKSFCFGYNRYEIFPFRICPRRNLVNSAKAK